jgi:hypothetical protein
MPNQKKSFEALNNPPSFPPLSSYKRFLLKKKDIAIRLKVATNAMSRLL